MSDAKPHNQLRRRWLRRSMILVTVSVAVAVAAFAVIFGNYYSSAVRNGLTAKAKTASEFFAGYAAKSYHEYYDSALRYMQAFPDRDRIELQFVSTDGQVVMSSIGIPAGILPNTPDIVRAVKTGEISVWTGRRPMSGEHIMAVSAPMTIAGGQTIGVMRYVTKLDRVTRQTALSTLAVAAVGALIIVVVMVINMMFVRVVINPVAAITHVTRSIAAGGYGTVIPGEFRDEMGEMVVSINEMSQRIAQAEKVKSEFLSSISHELRTPLTAIQGWSETLAYDDALDDDTRRGLAVITRESRRLSKMVEELLEYSRMEDGRFTLNVELIDLEAEVEDAIMAYRELLTQYGMELRYFPPDEPLPLLTGDANRLRQVVLNLLDNAAKYARDGRRVDVRVERLGDRAYVIIRDYGAGLPEDEIPKLKTKFFKGSNARGRGSGIGLAVCDEIMRYHGGTLDIANVYDSGGHIEGLQCVAAMPINNDQLTINN